MRTLDSESVNCIVTSPPYWGLRDYGSPGQLGLEPTFAEYLSKLVAIFDECRRVLRKDGTCWVNMGDSYSSGGRGSHGSLTTKQASNSASRGVPRPNSPASAKNLIGQPWRLAFALQDAGWILRSDIIWHKPNPMPESVQDRPTRAHEYVFLFVKSQKYWYDAEAIRENSETTVHRNTPPTDKYAHGLTPSEVVGRPVQRGGRALAYAYPNGIPFRNVRTVWKIATQSYPEAHFATFPEELPKRCILAGCPEGGTVLDPFAGSGTTLAVAIRLGRQAIGIELNESYCELARRRIAAETPSLFAGIDD